MDVKNTFWKDYPALEKQLSRVQKLMKSHVLIKNKAIKAAIFDIFDAGGKMLRPAYLLLFAEFTDLADEEKLALAASVEMMHTATLVHDDVIDRADTRRGVPTISAKYGPEIAVYAGDYLFIAVFKLMSEHSLELSNLSKNIGSIERLLGGELGQLNQHFDLHQTLDAYLENISGKTGELFALSASVAPLIAKNNSLANRAYKIGMNIGIAFQIMDDYLDYAASAQQLGKPVLEDIKQGIYSAPVLFALQENFDELATLIEAKRFDEVYDFIRHSGALSATKALAQSYTQSALTLIDKLPKGENRERIAEITRKLLERTL
ncbi:polyprenyl synthetase family protein [Lactococcus kimchii]|uniref:polyprenyl synthetase family protein n=1 Tax=Lactococcus sp. S-13 TaxID=2507158 RepID=UPI001023E192|nr:polyprenyl synthetase family protein [Lactococcus sp. S-13]RZI48105.1 polyprenyl synthetase family protein [Lactococcus sp. S-13]